jgi:AraC-like DNA-binding protein
MSHSRGGVVVKDHLFIHVDKYFFQDEDEMNKVKEINDLLDFLNVNFSLEPIPNSQDSYLILSYDPESIRKIRTRNAGRRKSYKAMHKNLTYGEVKQLLQEHSAEEVSQMLEMSRRTLYRRLKEYKDTPFIHPDSDIFC